MPDIKPLLVKGLRIALFTRCPILIQKAFIFDMIFKHCTSGHFQYLINKTNTLPMKLPLPHLVAFIFFVLSVQSARCGCDIAFNHAGDTTGIDKYKKYIDDNLQKNLQEFNGFVAIPSISSLPAHKADVLHCAEWLKNRLGSMGLLNAQVLPTEGHPVVFAEWNKAPGKPTVLIYGHYDVQPVQEAFWTGKPFEPRTDSGRIYGRGASDDKGGVITAIWAIEAMLVQDGKLPVNVKFFFEGEEEIGSPHMEKFVTTHKDLLKADYTYSVDAMQESDTQPEMEMSVRGGATMEFKLTTANRDLHSGVYGGKLPNAAQALAQIIASLHTTDGKVAVAGFYDNVKPMTAEEKAMAAKAPYDEKKEMQEYGAILFAGEKGYTALERVWYRPTLDVTGTWSGYTADDGFLNIIPASAHCRLMCRLVEDQKGDEIIELIKKHIAKNLPPGVAITYKDLGGFANAAAKFSSNTPAFKAAFIVLTKLYGKEPLLMGSGGSNAAMAIFKTQLGQSAYSFGFLQNDENYHSHNEFMRISDLQKGQYAFCMLLTYIGGR
jgi:acetylornithine deacetylase/succinyl-diaminopimelate desuccinylase-like protein